MAKFYDSLNDMLKKFIQEQMMFFTATSPKEGRINLSPKGLDSFRCLDDHTVAYLDLTGSGNETAAHLKDDGRITIMFCSFGPKPLILRLYGTGRNVRPSEPEWPELISQFPEMPGTRQIIVMKVESAQTSCGWAVPLAENMMERPTLVDKSATKSDEDWLAYWKKKNSRSIDDLPTGLLD